MARLFKKHSLKEKLLTYHLEDLDLKLEIIQKWITAKENKSLYEKTETQCEQAFNNDFFIKILGYTQFPNEHYTIDPKAYTETSSQKPDAILGSFKGDRKGVVTAVVEIKDAGTLLDYPQRRAGNMTPIQQAFKYKPQYKDCRFVIATNFLEFRLFQDNELDYEKFTLQDLADPKDNYYELKKFVYLLSAKNFIRESGESNTEKFLSEIIIEEKKISDDFYRRFSDLRLKLMRNLWKNNPNKRDINLITRKAQKLLDRIVFVCFCEDKGLLPDNILQNVYSHAQNNYSSMWDTLKGFFHAIDKGSPKLEIPEGYNGGLFKDDSELDALNIDDEVLQNLSILGEYNYEDDLTVNILGHIFEQSISDLEGIKKKASDPHIEISSKSKRKVEGIYYTPDFIIDHIVKSSLGLYLKKHEQLIYKKHGLHEGVQDETYRKREVDAWIEYQEFLKKIRILDPACGSGSFLVKVFEYLLEENRRVGNLIGGLYDVDELYKEILQNNIYGVDLNEESVEITQLSLWLKTAQKGKKLTSLGKNIKVGNSVISDPEVVGEKAFNWNTNFSDVMDKGGFDVIVGNPPYIATKEIPKSQRDYFWNKLPELLSSEMDLYQIFLYESLKDHLKKDGILGFITPNSFYTTKSFANLRKYLMNNTNIIKIIDFPYRFYPFEDVNKETCIQIFEKSFDPKNVTTLEIAEKNKDVNAITIQSATGLLQSKFNSDYRGRITVKPSQFLESMLSQPKKLGDYVSLHKGWMSIPTSTALADGRILAKGIFTTSDLLIERDLINYTRKYLEGKDIHRYYYEDKAQYVSTVGMDKDTAKWQLDAKIILQRIVGQNVRKIFASIDLDEHIIFPNANLINVIEGINIYSILGLLNSNLIDRFYNDYHGESNTNITKTAIEEIPCPDLRKVDFSNLSDKVKLLIDLTSTKNSKMTSFLDVIKQDFSVGKLPTKLQRYDKLVWDDFVNALEKLVSRITFERKAELKEFFEVNSEEVKAITNQIDKVNESIEEYLKRIYSIN